LSEPDEAFAGANDRTPRRDIAIANPISQVFGHQPSINGPVEKR